ncbi:citrate synthase [Bradyrhizobium pachyrhizi]|uniref:citrate synthase n=1 Tax=Bradyrhizobium pachyrhizi TaxID=280333 RepID=UPI003D369F6A
MSAEEAAAKLNISVSTLYTYVSRKQLRVVKLQGTRASQYLRDDIEALSASGTVGALERGVPGVTSSTITLVSDVACYYRGVSTATLAKTATLEEVARLLWETGEDDPFTRPTRRQDELTSQLLAGASSLSPSDRLAIVLLGLEASNPHAYTPREQSFHDACVEILRWTVALAVGGCAPVPGSAHEAIGKRFSCDAAFTDVIRRVLVLSADQALEPSTFAVRAAANTGATPYKCVVVGLAAASGTRLPSVRASAFSRFIAEIDKAEDPTEPVRTRLREGEALPGFGYSPAHTGGLDSRSDTLLANLRSALSNDPRFVRFDQAIALGTDITGRHPDFALLSAWVGQMIGLEPQLGLIRIGRIVGWLAHAREQQRNPLYRWKTTYKGRLPSD